MVVGTTLHVTMLLQVMRVIRYIAKFSSQLANARE